ncbi:MAG: histidine kinase dimerization/phospho-acceptor domain-containing protein [Myxococcota bacterium]
MSNPKDAPPGSTGPGAPRDSDALGRRLRHDIRSPLAVVLGQCELLELGIHGPLNEKQRAAIASIRNHSERALEMLDEVAARLSRGAET